ncbi:MAG: hypothetical protein ACYC4S_14145 [Rhodoferax sp.]
MRLTPPQQDFSRTAYPCQRLRSSASRTPENNLAPFYLSQINVEIEELTRWLSRAGLGLQPLCEHLARIDSKIVWPFRLDPVARTA